MTPLAASAQTPALSSEAPTAMTPAEVKAAYQSCPVGYYSGPRPGKSRYTKDDYLWVVTPEFAAAYCMPPEFIDKTLKGAEAIAYKLVYEGAENCGFGGNKEACTTHRAWLRDLLQVESAIAQRVQHEVQLPAVYAIPSSKHLIGPHSIGTDKDRQAWEAERPGSQRRFKGWGLVGVKGPKPVWPITALREIQYIEELLPGYNYLSVEGSMGHFSNPRGEKMGATQFVLGCSTSSAKPVRTKNGTSAPTTATSSTCPSPS
ncbi:MAG: hypothetical protein IPF55_03435 [Rhodoferax sp.]|nr:hypothetical protein [Rhodoferax sp.]